MKIQNQLVLQLVLILIFTPVIVAYENLIQMTFNIDDIHNGFNIHFLLTIIYIGLWVWLAINLYRMLKKRLNQYTLIKKDVLETLVAANETLVDYTNTEIAYLREDIQEYFKKVQSHIPLKNQEGVEISPNTPLHDLTTKRRYSTNKAQIAMSKINERLTMYGDKSFESIRKHIESESTLKIISPAKSR